MANEYVSIKDKKDGLGQIAISNNVFNHIVSIVVQENKSVHFDDGSSKKSLVITNANGHVTITIKVRVQYGNDVERVIKSLQNELHTTITTMVEFSAFTIDVQVVGFKFN